MKGLDVRGLFVKFMKHTLALVLMVFGLVGCATTPTENPFYEKSSGEWRLLTKSILKMSGSWDKRFIDSNGNYFVETRNDKGERGRSLLYYKLDREREIIYFKASEKFYFNTIENMFPGPKFCLPLLDTPHTKSAPIQMLDSNEAAILCINKNDYFANQRLEKLNLNKNKCLEYGFKDDSDGMGLCLIELDKLAAIKNQSEQANQAQLNILQQQQAEAKRQREANALINLGAIIGGAGTPAPSSTRSKASTPSYPTYTSSMTVPSNQLCPQLTSRLVKQEVVRGNRICYYQ